MNLVLRSKRFFETVEINKLLRHASRDIFQSNSSFEAIVERYVGRKKEEQALMAFCALEIACDDTIHFLQDKRKKVFVRYEEVRSKLGKTRSLQPVIDLQEITAKIEFMLARLRVEKEQTQVNEPYSFRRRSKNTIATH
ncbi:hypothetical protein [Spongiivirga citrea]|uniref:Uncharacterized protein n=1 Tax=Spongiivirga citrea TaxID=1481457 RepID=A0A6M0CKM5_9FLAO|nr:hypothetical protein [Spongiivirga citrea]NER18202.1 hypothetical protein [Spongiivirga citrea]